MYLDTNTYSALARGVQSVIDTISSTHRFTLPLPVIAELRYGFAKGTKAEYNESQLQKFLAQPQVEVAVPDLGTTQYYANLQLLCQQQGKALSQNDIWIAALAYEAEEALITFDQDFKVFQDLFGDKLIILS